MLRRWIPGLMAVAIVLLATESVFAQRLLERIRSRRDGQQQDNTYVQPVQTQTQPVVGVQPQIPQQEQSFASSYTTYERRGRFGRRSAPVQMVSSNYQNTIQPQVQVQPQQGQPQPVVGTGQPASTTLSQGTTTYYERRGLFGRRSVPVQGAATIPMAPVGSDPTTRRAFYLEPGSAAVLLNVRVPANAEVLVDGQRTNQTGAARQFVSPPLAPGFEYTYTVEARWQENGQPQTKTRKVTVQPGREVIVDFNQPDPQ